MDSLAYARASTENQSACSRLDSKT
jgi:hypothetical protein